MAALSGNCNALARRGGIAADWAGPADAWRAAYAPSLDRGRHGERPWTKLVDLHRAGLDRLLPGHGVAAPEEAARAELTHFWHRPDGWSDTVPGLVRLRRDFIIAPLSNGNVALLVDMARHACLPWDTVFGADMLRAYKPDPRTYLGACDLLGLAPGAVMMCAAHNADLHAAAGVGPRTALIARPRERGPGQTSDLAAEEPWDASAQCSLAMLEKLAHGSGAMPPNQHFIRITVPNGVSYEVVDPAALPDWAHSGCVASRHWGERWQRERRSAVPLVPSIVAQVEYNVLINPDHPQFSTITDGPHHPVWWDARLFG